MRLLCFAVVFATLLLIGCTNGESGDPELSSATVTADDSTTSSTDSTTSSSVSTTTTEPSQSVEEAWVQVWDLLLAGGDADELVDAGLVSAEAGGALAGIDLAGATVAETYPRSSSRTDRRAEITDCVLLDTRFPVWLEATVTRPSTDVEWVVESVELLDDLEQGCVPQEVAGAAIAGAQAFWDAEREFWDPADPNHPLIDETTTGSYREFLEDLLTRMEQDGVRANLTASEPAFGVFRVETNTRILLVNCFAPDAEFGFYSSTGNLIDGSPPVVEGQTDIQEPLMIREVDGDETTWKVSDLGGGIDVGCDPNSTASHLPVH